MIDTNPFSVVTSLSPESAIESCSSINIKFSKSAAIMNSPALKLANVVTKVIFKLIKDSFLSNDHILTYYMNTNEKKH